MRQRAENGSHRVARKGVAEMEGHHEEQATVRTPLFEPNDMALYRAALRADGLTRAEARRLFAEPERPGGHDADAALNRLCAIGLLRPSGAGGKRLRPVSPTAVETSLVSAFLREARRAAAEIDRVQRELAPMAAVYRGQRSADSGALVLHTGRESIDVAVEAAATTCRAEALACYAGEEPSHEVLGRSLPATLAMVDRGVRLRVIFQHGARGSVAAREFARGVRQQRSEVRMLDESLPPLIVFDRTVVFIPGPRDRETAVEVRLPALLDFLVGLFDQAWLRAHPYVLTDRGGEAEPAPDEMELAILRHLVSGDTDAKTAQRLGISVRLCQTYISRISARLGSRSRGQLGYLVAQSGLLQQRSEESPGERHPA